MTTYSIRPIALCGGPRDLSQYTHLMNVGTKTRSLSYIWYIEGSQPRTLVDTGVPAAGGFGDELTTVENGLGKLGLKPEDIEIVILTHLHLDHIELAHLYKNAKFIVQKKELDYALNPHPIDLHIYQKKLFENLNMEVIDGEKEIIPGISVLLSPGHSPGGQSIVVNTTAGKAIITGFCCHLSTFVQTEEMKRRGREVSLPAIHHDVREIYDSVLRVKRMADVILTLHDPVHADKEVIP